MAPPPTPTPAVPTVTPCPLDYPSPIRTIQVPFDATSVLNFTQQFKDFKPDVIFTSIVKPLESLINQVVELKRLVDVAHNHAVTGAPILVRIEADLSALKAQVAALEAAQASTSKSADDAMAVEESV